MAMPVGVPKRAQGGNVDLLDIVAALLLGFVIWSTVSSMNLTLTCSTLVQGGVD